MFPVSRSSFPCGTSSRKTDQSCSMFWKASWSMRCPSYRTVSERGTVWNKPCEGPVFLSAVLHVHTMTQLTSAIVIFVFCVLFQTGNWTRPDRSVHIWRYGKPESRGERETRDSGTDVYSFHTFWPWTKAFEQFIVNLRKAWDKNRESNWRRCRRSGSKIWRTPWANIKRWVSEYCWVVFLKFNE